MNTLNFLDANVWLALVWSRHMHSDRAREWFEASSEEKFFFCRFTQLTVLRLLTTEKVMGSDARGMAETWKLWDLMADDPRIAVLSEPPELEAEFRIHSSLPSRSPKVWADAYLIAFSALAGTRLVTFDQALKSRSVDVVVL